MLGTSANETKQHSRYNTVHAGFFNRTHGSSLLEHALERMNERMKTHDEAE